MTMAVRRVSPSLSLHVPGLTLGPWAPAQTSPSRCPVPGRPEGSVPRGPASARQEALDKPSWYEARRKTPRPAPPSRTFQNLPDYSAAATQWQLPRQLDLTSCLPQGPANPHPAQGPGASFAGRLFLPFYVAPERTWGHVRSLRSVRCHCASELRAPSPWGPPRRAPACLEPRGASGQLTRALPRSRF